MDLNHFWNWYWQDKAQLGLPAPFHNSQLIDLWNWLMSYDLVRVGILLVLAFGVLAAVGEALMDLFNKPGPVQTAPVSPERITAEKPPELTLQELRKSLDRFGKTQSDLATALGVSRAYVSQLLKGTKPLTDDLQLRCRQVLDNWNVNR